MVIERERLVAMIDKKQKEYLTTIKEETGKSQAAQVREALDLWMAQPKQEN